MPRIYMSEISRFMDTLAAGQPVAEDYLQFLTDKLIYDDAKVGECIDSMYATVEKYIRDFDGKCVPMAVAGFAVSLGCVQSSECLFQATSEDETSYMEGYRITLNDGSVIDLVGISDVSEDENA